MFALADAVALKMCRQRRLPFVHKDKHALDGLAVVLDKLQFSRGRAVVPREVVRKERHHVALVSGIEIVELVTLGFENSDSTGRPTRLHGEDEIGIYLPVLCQNSADVRLYCGMPRIGL